MSGKVARMSGLRFTLTLVGLFAVFVGGGLIVDHWNKLESTSSAPPSQTASAPSPASVAPVVTEAADATATARELAPKAETRMRKEFDSQAADAAAEAQATTAVEAESTDAAPSSGATRSLAPELVSLDTVRLSADTASVIAGQAPAGAEVTLLANGTPLGKAVAGEEGAWTIVLDEPVAPGSYKLALSVIGQDGTPVVREVGEATAAAPAVDVASAAPASGEAAAGEAASAGTPAPVAPAGSEVATAAEALAEAVTVAVPAPVFEPAGVPPDLATPAAGTVAASEPADAIADGDGVQLETPSDAASTTAPAEVAGNADGALTEQAGEVADSISDMFTDWLKASRDQAQEAAKAFTLATAGYKTIAETLGVVTMSGRGPGKAKVQVLVDGAVIGSAEIAESGRWLIEVPRLLTPGPHAARAQILAVDGSLIADRFVTFMGPLEVVAQAPAVAGPAPTAEGDPTPAPVVLAAIDYESMGPRKGRVTISGRAAAGASIAVSADGERIGSATADGDGQWLHASDTWLDIGAHAIRAEHMSATGAVLGRTLSEFVRLPVGDEVAAGAPAAPPAAKVAVADEETSIAKPRKRSARVHLRKRAKPASKVAKKEKRTSSKVASRKKDLGYQIVNVHKGKELSRVRVRMPGRKGKVMSFMVPKGPGWVRARRGDSLWGLAGKWYGNGGSYPVIAGFNSTRVLDPDRIRPRQRLHVP